MGLYKKKNIITIAVVMMMVKKKKKTQPFKLHVYSNCMNVLWLKEMNQQTKIYSYMGRTK